MSERMAYVNGQLVPDGQASVSIYDLGYQYGFGVFERTRTFHGRPFRLDAHIDRLFASLKMTRIDSGLSPAEMTRATLDLVETNAGLLGPDDDYSIGHFISIGPSGGPTVVIFTQPLPFRRYAKEYLTGAEVVTPSIRQMPSDVVDPKMKTTSRMHFRLAELEAQAVQPEAYALILDHEGNVCEVSPGANFWIVRKDTLISPPGSSILRGVSRATVFELASQCGLGATEADFQVYDVMTADEAFLSVTSRCILPVVKVNGVAIGTGSPGRVTGQLLQAWSDLVGVDIVGQALAHVPTAERQHVEPVAVS